MRSTVWDFDSTIIFPLFVIALVSLWNAVRLFREEKRFGNKPEAEGAKRLIQVSSMSTVILFGLFFTGDFFKIGLLSGVSELMGLVGMVAVAYYGARAWESARERKWLAFGMCVVAILLATSSVVHFLHQNMNTERILGPRPDDEE
jgi:formate hydrogenlyase subunit 3/multisubunit Na+/H+ antiporter MnhD subunit